MWSGDNAALPATWEHMAVGVKIVRHCGYNVCWWWVLLLLESTNLAHVLFFSTADVGGFFGKPESEMLVIFAPLFHAHAHIDTKCREPNLLDQPYKAW
ncbi:glycoside hydrolase family 31 protein [Amanita muscaria Koide BX008]|uniref:Glycoside hydrolase family 31 protein n=1 Tax=Amanita muscaria (strain Koide BX008) TaxID=946122 RepID=A0A0C2WB29_AMAMK|nr:glycoside hydrolase family 31 protein [Amanita muscaria Koide BX008]